MSTTTTTTTTLFSSLITEDIKYPIFACLAIVAQFFFTNMICMKTRKIVFPNHWMKTEFGDQHYESFKRGVPDSGYPDMGEGRFAEKLSYKNWVLLATSQRIAYNYLEQIPPLVFCTMVAGIKYWILATIFAGAHFVGRLAYSIGYSSSPRGRIFGSLLNFLSLIAQIVLAFVSCLKIVGAL